MNKSVYERDGYFSNKELTHSDLFVQLRSLALAGRLNESNVDVGEDTTGGDGGLRKKLVELLIVADSKLDVRGMILLFLESLAALPASSRTSAARYSRTAAR